MTDVWKSFEESLRKGFDKIWDFVGKSTSILVASAFIIFALGSLFGYFISTSSYFSQGLEFLLLIPPILGLIAYYYRTFAIIIFILFLLFLFL